MRPATFAPDFFTPKIRHATLAPDILETKIRTATLVSGFSETKMGVAMVVGEIFGTRAVKSDPLHFVVPPIEAQRIRDAESTENPRQAASSCVVFLSR
jgi:hypothetical protein